MEQLKYEIGAKINEIEKASYAKVTKEFSIGSYYTYYVIHSQELKQLRDSIIDSIKANLIPASTFN